MFDLSTLNAIVDPKLFVVSDLVYLKHVLYVFVHITHYRGCTRGTKTAKIPVLAVFWHFLVPIDTPDNE